MNKALELFSAIPRQHNCAQSVACGCGRSDLQEELRSCGGGMAPGGLCGAIYAAGQMIPEHKAEMERDFIAKLGSGQCAVLKKELHVPCTACVALAAELAEQYEH